MIPFAALACMLEMENGQEREVSIQDLSALGFTFRVPQAWAADLAAGICRITLRAHRFSGDETCVLQADAFRLSVEEHAPDWTLWRLETDNAGCRALLRTYMADFQQYAAQKLAGDDEQMTAVLTGVQTDMGTTARTFADQRATWLSGCAPDAAWTAAALAVPELAVSLTDRQTQEVFLSMTPTAFAAWYWQAHGWPGHPLAARPFNCVYIGSQYCAHLFPNADLLEKLLARCDGLGVRPVLALAPVTEGRLDAMLALLTALAAPNRPSPLELVVNDWGLPELLRGQAGFALTCGVLLNKRRKDVRLPAMQGFGGREGLMAENAANDPAYRSWLTAQGFTRLSVEACGYPYHVPQGPLALHLPFYQMNTAGRCTLAARCETGKRGRQRADVTCSRWCGTHAFLYPDALGMVGRYNTLFGLDARAMADGAYLRSLMKGADRLVIDLL